jgi:hypothetical protein
MGGRKETQGVGREKFYQQTSIFFIEPFIFSSRASFTQKL